MARQPDFSSISFTIHGSKFLFGDFVNSVVSFVIIAAAVYFTVVLPVNTLMAKIQHDNKLTQPSNKKCPECLSEIPIDARRCAHCTQPVG